MDIHDYLSAEERRLLQQPNDLLALWGFVFNWALILAALWLAARWPTVPGIMLAWLVVGGRQMGLGVLLHDCAHRCWFSSPRLNEFCGHWLAGMPMLVPLDFYRRYHFAHHTKTGTDEDPDLGNVRNYPVSGKSLARKLLRDLAGVSGIRNALALLLYVHLGRAGNAKSMGLSRTGALSGRQMLRRGLRNYTAVILTQAVLFAALLALDAAWTYLIWWWAYLTSYQLFARIRQIGEHGAMPELATGDVRRNTRTTRVRWWERLTISPNFVNYHCEHHLAPTVPGYHLPRMHRLLRERGFYQGHDYAALDGYGAVLQAATAP